MSLPGFDKEGCGRWEAAVVDLLDGVLPPEQEVALREHAARCESCGPLLPASEHGRLWARLLHDAPAEPPLDLFGRILAKTDALPLPPGHEIGHGAGLSDVGAMVLPHPAFMPGSQRAARWLMTGTMALFSLALTASVSGVHPGQLSAAAHDTLHGEGPGSIQGAASRRFFDAKKQVVSFYDNFRLVREVENQVDALRRQPAETRREPADSLQPSARLSGGLPAPARLRLPGDPQTSERNCL